MSVIGTGAAVVVPATRRAHGANPAQLNAAHVTIDRKWTQKPFVELFGLVRASTLLGLTGLNPEAPLENVPKSLELRTV